MNRERGRKGEEFFTFLIYKHNIRGSVHRLIHFVCWYLFAFINLVCVQSVIQLMNTIINETVTFYVLFDTSRPSLLFSVE